MASVLVIYASDYENTKKMAETVADGARSVDDTKVTIKEAGDVSKDDMTGADAVIVGSPVHMGTPHWKVKKFIDEICSPLWMKDAMEGKVAAVFATGSGFGQAGGGAELTMVGMLNNFAELGMLMVPLPKSTDGYGEQGLQWGPYGRSMDVEFNPTGLSDDALKVARKHGANVARVVKQLGGAVTFND